MTAAQTPLADLLDKVPEDIVLGVSSDGPFPSFTNIPIGKLAREAAAELHRLQQRKPLTDDEIANAANSVRWSDQYHIDFARAIERAHGIGA